MQPPWPGQRRAAAASSRWAASSISSDSGVPSTARAMVKAPTRVAMAATALRRRAALDLPGIDSAKMSSRGARHGAPAGLSDEIVLGGKMAVKTAMGQIGRFHDVGNADAAEPLGAEQ